MDAYKLLARVVRSGVWEQDAEIGEVSAWASHWLRIHQFTEKEFKNSLMKIARDEGIFYDGMEEDFIDAAINANDSEIQFKPPIYQLGDLCRFLPKDAGEKYRAGPVSTIDWSFKKQCWLYRLGDGEDCLMEDCLVKQSLKDVV